MHGVNSVRIKAHPFLCWVAKVKCFCEFDLVQLQRKLAELLRAISLPTKSALDAQDLSEFPEFVRKCFSEENLRKLKFICDTIMAFEFTPQERDLFLLALADTLRSASKAGAGWPYIAPSEYHAKQERDAITVFSEEAQSR